MWPMGLLYNLTVEHNRDYEETLIKTLSKTERLYEWQYPQHSSERSTLQLIYTIAPKSSFLVRLYPLLFSERTKTLIYSYASTEIILLLTLTCNLTTIVGRINLLN